MKVGGQILWNVTPICGTSQIYCLMGRRLVKDVLGNHLSDRSFRLVPLVEYHPFTAKDQSRIHQFGKKILPGLVLGYALYAGRIWKGDVLVADLEELETMDASEIYSKKTQCERGDISQTRRIYFSNRPWRRSGTENIHLGTASTNSRRGSRWLSWRIRRVSSTTSRLTSGYRWSDKWF